MIGTHDVGTLLRWTCELLEGERGNLWGTMHEK